MTLWHSKPRLRSRPAKRRISFMTTERRAYRIVRMFERYTEKARRTIFFARQEASQFGSPHIEVEFLLLGLLRENAALSTRFFRSGTTPEALRAEIERNRPPKPEIATSVDLPLSNESKQVLAYAAEEAERLGHNFIGTEHLLLGILRQDRSFAAGLLHRAGVTADAVRKDVQDDLRGSHPLAGAAHRTLGYFQLVLKVTNLAASVDFYRKLGFTPARQTDPDTAILNSPGCQLRLERSPAPSFDLSFRGADLAAVASSLKTAGIPFEKRSASNTLELQDPDGNTVTLHSLYWEGGPPAR